MTKRQKASDEKRRREISELEYEVRLIAYGANGGCDLGDEDDTGNLLGCMSPGAFSNYLCALRRIWKSETAWWISIHHIGLFDTVRSSAEWMHSQGARAGGRWVK